MMFQNPRVYRSKVTNTSALHIGYAYDYDDTNFSNMSETPDFALVVIGGRVVVMDTEDLQNKEQFEFMGGTAIPTI